MSNTFLSAISANEVLRLHTSVDGDNFILVELDLNVLIRSDLILFGVCFYVICSMAQVLSLDSIEAYGDYEFNLLSIASSARPHSLVWGINEQLGIRLKKAEDILFNFKNGSEMSISNYLFETEHTTVRVFENRAVEFKEITRPYLVPELKEYDYFFKFEGDSDLFELEELLEDLKRVSQIQYVTRQEVSDLTSRDNLIT